MKLKLALLTLSLIATMQLNAMEDDEYEDTDPDTATTALDSPRERAQRKLSSIQESLDHEYSKDIHRAKESLIIENGVKAFVKGSLTVLAGAALGYAAYKRWLTDTDSSVRLCWATGTGFASGCVGLCVARKNVKNIQLLKRLGHTSLLNSHRSQCNAIVAQNFYALSPATEWDDIKLVQLIDLNVRKEKARGLVSRELKFAQADAPQERYSNARQLIFAKFEEMIQEESFK